MGGGESCGYLEQLPVLGEPKAQQPAWGKLSGPTGGDTWFLHPPALEASVYKLLEVRTAHGGARLAPPFEITRVLVSVWDL